MAQGAHEVGWGEWAWGNVTYAAGKVDQATGVVGVYALTGQVVSMDSASGSQLLGAAGSGAADGGSVVLDTASFGYVAHERSQRAQQEAIARGDVVSQIGLGAAKVGGRTIQAIGVVGGGTLVASMLPGAVVSSSLMTTAVATSSVVAPPLLGTVAYYNAQESYYNLQNGDIINGIASAGDAGLNSAFAASSILVRASALGVGERAGAGEGYALQVREGGSGTAYAGHGTFRFGSGTTIVPEGAPLTLPRDGIKIADRTGHFIERGDWEGLAEAARLDPRIADDITGMATYLPVAEIPNYTLTAPKDLVIFRNSFTVEDPVALKSLLVPNQGYRQWAACTQFLAR